MQPTCAHAVGIISSCKVLWFFRPIPCTTLTRLTPWPFQSVSKGLVMVSLTGHQGTVFERHVWTQNSSRMHCEPRHYQSNTLLASWRWLIAHVTSNKLLLKLLTTSLINILSSCLSKVGLAQAYDDVSWKKYTFRRGSTVLSGRRSFQSSWPLCRTIFPISYYTTALSIFAICLKTIMDGSEQAAENSLHGEINDEDGSRDGTSEPPSSFNESRPRRSSILKKSNERPVPKSVSFSSIPGEKKVTNGEGGRPISGT